MIPKYTGEWNRGSIWRGDTLLGFSMRIADKDTDVPIAPVSVCVRGRLPRVGRAAKKGVGIIKII